jgi:hypothetical protein
VVPVVLVCMDACRHASPNDDSDKWRVKLVHSVAMHFLKFLDMIGIILFHSKGFQAMRSQVLTRGHSLAIWAECSEQWHSGELFSPLLDN